MSAHAETLKQRLRRAAVQSMLDCAERVIIRKGYTRATMHEIATATGCGAGTFYLYFRSKEVILQQIVARRARVMFDAARRAMGRFRDPLAKVRAGIEAILAYVNQHRSFFRVLFSALPMRQAALGRELGPAVQRERRAYDRLELALLREAQRKGLLRNDFRAEVLQQFMCAVAFSLVERWIASRSPPSLPTQQRTLWGLMSGGIGVRSRQLEMSRCAGSVKD